MWVGVAPPSPVTWALSDIASHLADLRLFPMGRRAHVRASVRAAALLKRWPRWPRSTTPGNEPNYS